MKRQILALGLSLCLLLGACGPKAAPEPSPYEEDAQFLVETVESIHPCFVLDDVPEGYQTAKEALLSEAKTAKDDGDFALLCARYCSSLRDGHTQVYLQVAVNKVLDVAWYYDGQSLWLLDEAGKPSQQQVTHIGGVAVEQVVETLRGLVVMENESALRCVVREDSRYDCFLDLTGVDCGGESVELTLADGSSLTALWLSAEELKAQSSEEGPSVSGQLMGDVFYIDHDHCKEDLALESVIHQLDQALEEGCSKVIYDVRGNPGGNSNACLRLLQHMGMLPPNYGWYARLSETSRKAHPDYYGQTEEDYIIKERDLNATQNPDIQLLVLSDEWTFSSANMLCVWVQDGKLGQIIGQGSSNCPSSYGDILGFGLPNSGLKGQISFKRFLRPDANADQKQLQPDIPLPYGEDALAYALELLK